MRTRPARRSKQVKAGRFPRFRFPLSAFPRAAFHFSPSASSRDPGSWSCRGGCSSNILSSYIDRAGGSYDNERLSLPDTRPWVRPARACHP